MKYQIGQQVSTSFTDKDGKARVGEVVKIRPSHCAPYQVRFEHDFEYAFGAYQLRPDHDVSAPDPDDPIPRLDHSILSPSGHVSKRSREAALERVRRELFGDGLAYPTAPQPTEAESLRRQAAELRELADRGMRPRAYRKKAGELEALADECDARNAPAPDVSAPVCDFCDGSGEVDSGGSTPQGHFISVACPRCPTPSDASACGFCGSTEEHRLGSGRVVCANCSANIITVTPAPSDDYPCAHPEFTTCSECGGQDCEDGDCW